jgi:hypothetical protein
VHVRIFFLRALDAGVRNPAGMTVIACFPIIGWPALIWVGLKPSKAKPLVPAPSAQAPLSPPEKARRRFPRLGVFDWWSHNPADIKSGVIDYEKGGQERHIAGYVLLAFAAFNTLAAYFGWVGQEGDWLDPALMVVLAFLVYQGHRRAMVAAMLYWTFSKGMQLDDIFQSPTHQGPVASILIYWAIVMGPMWRAFLVERARRRVTA